MALISQEEQALFFGTNQDLDAMNRYISSAETHTSKASGLKNEWRVWYDGLSWYTTNVYTDRDTLDLARNKVKDFNGANAVSEEQKNAAAQQQKGITAEEAQGGVKRTLEGTNRYAVKEDPFIKPWMVWTGVALAVGSVLLFTYGLAAAVPSAILASLGARRASPDRFRERVDSFRR